MKVKYDPYLDGNVSKKDLFEAGQQSRQAEIDELKWMLRNANGQADDFCKKSIELQKRIDKLTTINASLVAYKNELLEELDK